jgi:hypothetical protein
VCGVPTQSRTLYVKAEKKNNIFIQTDKPIYKPGQKGMNNNFVHKKYYILVH